MFALIVYIPEKNLEEVKNAMLAAGAGRIGNYDSCCWQTKGIGQFRPLEGANPAIGSVGEIERLEEWKVEMVVESAKIEAVVVAMKKAHPYETVAYYYTEVRT